MLARKTSHQSKELVASAIGLLGKQRERERKISDLESFWVWIRSTKSRPRRKKLHNKHVFQNQKSNAHAAEEEGTAGALALSGGGSCCHAMPRCRRAAATRAVAESKAVSSSSTTALPSSPAVLITTRGGLPRRTPRPLDRPSSGTARGAVPVPPQAEKYRLWTGRHSLAGKRNLSWLVSLEPGSPGP